MNKKSEEKRALISKVIRDTFNSQELWTILLEAQAIQAGPFDGGCLVCATALSEVFGGELVCMTPNVIDGEASHYGVLIDGFIYDFYGGHKTEDEWLKVFCENENLVAETFIVKKADNVVNIDIPLDENAVKSLVELLKKKK